MQALLNGQKTGIGENNMKMPGADIKPEWFYENEEGKTKLNWFLYEVALEYQSFIKSSAELKAYKKAYGDRNIALFCTHYAKQMKQSVLDRLEGKTDATIIDEEYITDFYPMMAQKDVNLLMDAACEAWDQHLSVCEACPTRCLSEKDHMIDLFDRYKREGLL